MHFSLPISCININAEPEVSNLRSVPFYVKQFKYINPTLSLETLQLGLQRVKLLGVKSLQKIESVNELNRQRLEEQKGKSEKMVQDNYALNSTYY